MTVTFNDHSSSDESTWKQNKGELAAGKFSTQLKEVAIRYPSFGIAKSLTITGKNSTELHIFSMGTE